MVQGLTPPRGTLPSSGPRGFSRVPPVRLSSAWVPSSRTTMRSGAATVERRWATTIAVRPRMRFPRASWTRASDSLSRALVASSSTRIGQSARMARAMATRWRCRGLVQASLPHRHVNVALRQPWCRTRWAGGLNSVLRLCPVPELQSYVCPVPEQLRMTRASSNSLDMKAHKFPAESAKQLSISRPPD